jgi:hypothetical protein
MLEAPAFMAVDLDEEIIGLQPSTVYLRQMNLVD